MANTIALRKVVPVNQRAFDAIEDIDRMVAFLNGAISMIQNLDTWAKTADEVEIVYVIEAAIERAAKVREALDLGLTQQA